MGGIKGQKTKDPIEEQRRSEEKKERESKKKDHKQEVPAAAEKRIVRLLATDLDGNQAVINALCAVKGISFTLAKAICIVTKIDFSIKAGDLSEDQLKQIEDVIRNPAKYGVPIYVLNDRKDVYTGLDVQLVGSDLDVWIRQHVSELKKYGSYRGWRHRLGQPVRGQRTRSSFRKSGTVGVIKGKAKPGAAPAEKK